jgi:hypothetical protein
VTDPAPRPPGPERREGSEPGWTSEALARLHAIAVPFVRRATARRVAEAARTSGVTLVDLPFFDRAASY